MLFESFFLCVEGVGEFVKFNLLRPLFVWERGWVSFGFAALA